MVFKLLKKYFGIFFVLATIMGASHHHSDLKQHSECKICVIQSSIADMDTPTQPTYLSKLDKIPKLVISKPKISYIKHTFNYKRPRSPPTFS